MEITTTTINRNPGRRAAVNALAIVGFIALLIIGIGLAIYSARYAPKIASRFSGAAVSLTSIFRKNDAEPQLQVVTATSSLPIIDTPVVVATSTATTTTVVKPTHPAGTGHTVTTVTTVTAPVQPYGNADLSVRITDTGYLTRSGNTGSFVASNSVPSGKNGAIKFTVTNTGTNVTGDWKFEVDVPTSPSQTFTSPTQESLAPGDSIDYVLGFEKGKKGDNREITVTVDSTNRIHESNENNNEASREIDIKD